MLDIALHVSNIGLANLTSLAILVPRPIFRDIGSKSEIDFLYFPMFFYGIRSEQIYVSRYQEAIFVIGNGSYHSHSKRLSQYIKESCDK